MVTGIPAFQSGMQLSILVAEPIRRPLIFSPGAALA
jgi:hypothetical protein